MKQTIILILCIFFILSLKAQDLNKIKGQNVFFILYESSDFTKKGCGTVGGSEHCEYSFSLVSDKHF